MSDQPEGVTEPDWELIDELTDAAEQVACVEAAARLELVKLIARLDTQTVWHHDGQRCMVDWVALRFGLARRTARQLVAVAAVIHDLPHLASVYAHGRLSWDQMVPLCELADETTDEAWATDGPTRTPEELNRMVRAQRLRDTDPAAVHEQRHVTFRHHRDGTTTTTIHGDTLDAEAARALFDRVADEQATRDPDTGQYPTRCQQRYDAWVSVCRRHLAADGDMDRATVVIHADVALLTGENPHGAATTPTGTPLAAETVRRHCCDARIQWALDTPDGHTLGVGRATRNWPPWLTRLIHRRDQHCRFPGCAAPIHHIHHIRHWTNHGPTNADNGVGLCWTHHHHVHEGGWTITGNPNHHLTFTSPHGRTLPQTRPRTLHPNVKRRMQGTTPGLLQPQPVIPASGTCSSTPAWPSRS